MCACGRTRVSVCEREKAGVSEGESGQPFLVVVCSPERGRRMEGRMSKKEEEDWKSSEEISLYKVEDIKGETKGGGADNDSLGSRKKNSEIFLLFFTTFYTRVKSLNGGLLNFFFLLQLLPLFSCLTLSVEELLAAKFVQRARLRLRLFPPEYDD